MPSLEKVSPGQRIRSLPANDWNAFVDAARELRGEQLDQLSDSGLPGFSPVVALVKNATGTHLPRYSVVGLGEPVADPQSQSDLFRSRIALTGVVPSASHCGRFAILASDLAPGFVGDAVIAGACLARIDVPPGGDSLQFANVTPGNATALQAKVIGGARILWREPGEGLKWGVVRLADAPQAMIHFQLMADLDLGGSALAAILEWNGGDWMPGSATILVHDWHRDPGMWQAASGMRGLALKNACLDRFEVVWMETPARSIEFVLAGPLAAGQAMAAVTNYYLQGKPPASTVTVYDAQRNYPRALAGAAGKARWNDRQRRYEVVECNQMAIALSCTLASDMCVSSASGAITGYSVLTFPPYGQAPVPPPSLALNRYKLAGRAGDRCLVVWAEALDDWIIAQVAHHEIEVPLAYRFYEGYLQAKHRKIAVMYCEDETDWRNEIKLEEAEIVDDVRFTGGGSSSGTGGTNGTSAESSPGDSTQVAGGTSTAGGQCGSIELRTAKAYFFEAPKEPAWKNVLTFQEQAVLVAAAGSNNCLVFQEVTVCTPCVGAADTTRVCASVATTATCQCTCDCGDSGGYTPASGGGSGCSCSCQASSSITFG